MSLTKKNIREIVVLDVKYNPRKPSITIFVYSRLYYVRSLIRKDRTGLLSGMRIVRIFKRVYARGGQSRRLEDD